MVRSSMIDAAALRDSQAGALRPCPATQFAKIESLPIVDAYIAACSECDRMENFLRLECAVPAHPEICGSLCPQLI